MSISIPQSEFVEVEALKIEIIVPGKISKHLLSACNYYMEKISRFAKIEVNHVNLGGDLNSEDANVIMKREAEYIERRLNGRKYILIDLFGKEMTSEQFSVFLERQFMVLSELVFVIGGPLGVYEKIRDNASERISFSKMTFTHEMCTVLLLEQIFRGFKILKNEKYHY
jgi:23S rRNA (pseudouridine1915-N3)-methyltransferase